jgi:tRNA threonylcarbamoyladenosine biosynthesis protein TsaE
LVLALVGTLGAGKTLFVKGLAEGLGVNPEQVASPTFTIVNEYADARGTRLAHVDLYRIERRDELEDVGFVDLLEPDAVVAVEWADRFPDALPGERLELSLVRPREAPEERVCQARVLGSESADVLERWRVELGSVSAVEMES